MAAYGWVEGAHWNAFGLILFDMFRSSGVLDIKVFIVHHTVFVCIVVFYNETVVSFKSSSKGQSLSIY